MFLEDYPNGGLRLAERHAELSTARAQTTQWSRLVAWSEWYEQAIATRLTSNHAVLMQQGAVSKSLLSKLDPLSLRLSEAVDVLAIRQELADSVSQGLERSEAPHPHFRVRQKLERWRLLQPPRIIADRFLRSMPTLSHLVPPRVIAAVFSTAWNRWCTARRFQKRDRACNQCLLGCGGGAEDSIEHYSRCRTVREFHRKTFNITADWLLPYWLGVQCQQGADEDLLACGALGAFSVYAVTNNARHGGSFSPEEALHALRQAAKEASLGHRRAMRVLSTRCIWRPGA